jgi:hypothetical protein
MGPLRSSNRQQRSPRHPITVTSSRWPRALIRRTQKPFSPLWYVTRSTRPASTSWVDGSGCGFMPIVTSAALPLRASLSKTRSDWRVAANRAMFRLMKRYVRFRGVVTFLGSTPHTTERSQPACLTISGLAARRRAKSAQKSLILGPLRQCREWNKVDDVAVVHCRYSPSSRSKLGVRQLRETGLDR